MIKRTLAILMALALLACVPVAVSAEETVAEQELFGAEILNSITEEEDTGKGLAFRFEANVRGAAVNDRHEFDNTNAVATVDGVDYQVVAMGAVMTNSPARIADIDNLTREDVEDADGTVLDIPAHYLTEVSEDSLAYTMRIIYLPEQVLGFAIGGRPYCVLKDAEGNEIVRYGSSDICTYNAVYYTNFPEETPALTATAPDLGDKLAVTAATATYKAICPNYREGFKVDFTLQNVSSNAHITAGSVAFSFKDADGNLLGTETVTVGTLDRNATKNVEMYIPVATATIEAATDLNCVPAITLPAIGTDIDVTKKKDRIRVSATEASFNEDGTIHVSLTFRNYTTNWITEETDYVQYTYYDAAGTKIKTETVYIGCIDTKKNVTKTFEFDVPANAASLKLTKSKIVYWTEWS